MEEDIWTAMDRESEEWRIKVLASRQREKWGPPIPDFPSRRLDRRTVSGDQVAHRLGALSQEYEAYPHSYSASLKMRALMVLWPRIMPYTLAEKLALTREEIAERRLDPKSCLLTIFGMVEKDCFWPNLPRIIIRDRKKSEFSRVLTTHNTKRSKTAKDEVIGRAVIAAYRRYPPGNRCIDSDFDDISKLGSVDGIQTRGFSNVRNSYHRYRRLAFERGYADIRAFECEYQGLPWPKDQVWLEDFPLTD